MEGGREGSKVRTSAVSLKAMRRGGESDGLCGPTMEPRELRADDAEDRETIDADDADDVGDIRGLESFRRGAVSTARGDPPLAAAV